jgi:hypothetical protein
VKFYIIDKSDPDSIRIESMTDRGSISAASKIVCTSFARWINSGEDYPDAEDTDGISEEEAAMEYSDDI